MVRGGETKPCVLSARRTDLPSVLQSKSARLKVTVRSLLSPTVRFEQRVSKSMIISNLVTFLRTCVQDAAGF